MQIIQCNLNGLNLAWLQILPCAFHACIYTEQWIWGFFLALMRIFFCIRWWNWLICFHQRKSMIQSDRLNCDWNLNSSIFPQVGPQSAFILKPVACVSWIAWHNNGLVEPTVGPLWENSCRLKRLSLYMVLKELEYEEHNTTTYSWFIDSYFHQVQCLFFENVLMDSQFYSLWSILKISWN